MKKILSLLVAFMIIFTLPGCSSQKSDNSSKQSDTTTTSEKKSHYPVTITNYNAAGEEITLTFEKAPERVLAVYQGSIETMIALGLEDKVVASYGLDNAVKDEWKDGFSRMKYNKSVFAPDKENVVMLNPDFIFSWGSIFDQKMLGDVDYWIGKGTNTYMNTNTRPNGSRVLENEYTDILNIGKIFNVEEKAEALVKKMKEDVEKANAASKKQEKAPTVAVLGFYDKGIRNFGKELAGDIASNLGLTVMDSSEKFMGKEDLIAADPDVIFVEYMPRPEGGGDAIKDEEMKKLLNDPSFASMKAVKNGRVYPIMLGEIYAPAVRTGDGIRTLANGAFPGLLN